MTLRPPPAFEEIARRLEDEGYEAWAVGGVLRDHLLGEHRSDWDLATSAHPHEVQSLFRRTIPLGIEHGTVGILVEDRTVYEVTTFRRDVETDGRHAVVTFADSIDDDLARRDFTINAMAWRPTTGEWRDPFGGRADLDARVLRAVGDPEARFSEDYLRVLRGLRFAGRFGLTIDPPTREALDEAVGGLSRLSAERVREELEKVLTAPRPSDALRLYRDSGALRAWYPALDAAADSADWDSALSVIDALHAGRPLLRLARLLLVIPGADDPEDPGRGEVEALLERLKFSRAASQKVLAIRDLYFPFVNPLDEAAQLREWLRDVGPGGERDLFRLHFAAARAAGDEQAQRGLVFLWRRVHDERLGGAPIDRADLAIDGHDLLALGVERGPVVGLLLDELHAQVLEDPGLNDAEQLRDRARELIDLAGLDGALPVDGEAGRGE